MHASSPSSSTASLRLSSLSFTHSALTAALVAAGRSDRAGDTLRGRVVDPRRPRRRRAPRRRCRRRQRAAPLTRSPTRRARSPCDRRRRAASPSRRPRRAPGFASPPARRGRRHRLELRLACERAVDETLVVTAAQVDQPLSLLGRQRHRDQREELDARQITTLGDALRLVPGFTRGQQRRAGHADVGLPARRRIRLHAGAGGRHARSTPSAAASTSRRCRSADVERVEIVRGPQSALYGADAIGGVVQVITRSGGPPSASARSSKAAAATRRRAAGTRRRGSRGRWQRAVDAQYRGRRLHRHAPADGETVSQRRLRARRQATVALRLARRRAAPTCAARCATSTPSAAPRALRLGPGRQLRRRRSHRRAA